MADLVLVERLQRENVPRAGFDQLVVAELHERLPEQNAGKGSQYLRCMFSWLVWLPTCTRCPNHFVAIGRGSLHTHRPPFSTSWSLVRGNEHSLTGKTGAFVRPPTECRSCQILQSIHTRVRCFGTQTYHQLKKNMSVAVGHYGPDKKSIHKAVQL